MLSAMARVIERLSETGALVSEDSPTEKLTRPAFRNSLCTHSVKCRLEIEYIPCGKADGLRASVTAAIRYTENMLRAALGVKSRLAIVGLPDEYKRLIDGYFSQFYDRVNKERMKANTPEYEKLYDAEEKGFSQDGADEIERASWSTTARLVVEEDAESGPAIESTKIIIDKKCETTEESYGLSTKEIEFLNDILNGRFDVAREVCRELGEEPLTVAERINEAFSDGFGDVVIEFDGDSINIIEDYKEEIEEWLTKRMK